MHSRVYNKDSTKIWIFGEGFDYNGRGERAEFDTNFILKRITWIPEVVDGYSHTKWFSESKLLFGGLYQIDPFGGGPQDNDMGISFIDTTLNMTFLHYFGGEDTIDYPAINRIFHYNDTNHIYIAGTYKFIIGLCPQGISWIMTGLLNHNLSTVYFHLYGGDAYYITTSILATSDGGSIISATRYDYFTQWYERDIYFLKLDENGLITTNELFSSEQKKQLLISPNPGKDVINIIEPWDGTLKLLSLYGQIMLTHSTEIDGRCISVATLPKGCYYYYFYTNNNNIFKGKWIKI